MKQKTKEVADLFNIDLESKEAKQILEQCNLKKQIMNEKELKEFKRLCKLYEFKERISTFTY